MFNVSDKIRLNPELCPQDKLEQKHFQFGALNYPVLVLDWEMEVVETFNDSYHGNMVAVKILNDDRVEADTIVYFRTDDCVIAKATKLKIDFTILGRVLKVQPLIDSNRAERAALMVERKKIGRTQDKTSKIMQANWKKVKALDLKLVELQEQTETVFSIKTPGLGQITLDCKEDQIEQFIRREIRLRRATAKKIVPTEKIIAGGIKYEKVGGVLSKAGEFAKINKDFSLKVINEKKVPNTKEDNYVGIEIECYGKKTIEQMKESFIKARLKKFVNVTTDGSIRPTSGNNGMEIRVCLAEKDLDTILPRIFKVIEDEKMLVNESCGTHVHVDMRNRNPELAYSNLFKLQELMLKTQPESRRSNQYCRKNTKKEVKLAEFGQMERYSVINTQSFSKHKTIEIRLHAGTVKFEDMRAWTKLLIAIVSKSDKLSSSVDTISELEELNLVDEETLKHLKTRIKKYA